MCLKVSFKENKATEVFVQKAKRRNRIYNYVGIKMVF